MNRSVLPFGTWLVAVLLLSGVAPRGNAAYLEGEGESPEAPRERIIRPEPEPPDGNAVLRLIRRVEVGVPYTYRGLIVYPVILPGGADSSGIRTLDEALDRGWIVVSEREEARVAELRVRNDSTHYVLLLAGEILAGGKQNRFVREDVLLAPQSGFVAVPVYCGERERWRGPTETFLSPQTLVHPQLRKSAAAGASQDAIWREIDAVSERASVNSPTRDYQQVYESDRVRARLDECVAGFRRFCRGDTVGLVVAAHGRIVGADLFADPALFARLSGKLLRSYALDEALEESDRQFGVSRESARDFLDRALSARFTDRSTPGAGRLWDITGAIDGTALAWDGRAVHVNLFAERAYIAPSPQPQPRPFWPPWPLGHRGE